MQNYPKTCKTLKESFNETIKLQKAITRKSFIFLTKTTKIEVSMVFLNMIETSYEAYIQKHSRRSLINTKNILSTSKQTFCYQIFMALH